MDRRSFFMLPLAAVPIAGYARYVEPGWLELTHDRVPVKGMQTGDAIRIVQLTDLHHSTDVPNSLIEQSFEIALAQKPDIICLTGDYITEGRGYDETWYRGALRRLSARVRCFATLGNHDGGAWAGKPGQRYTTQRVTDLLVSAGIPVLTNTYVDVPVRANRVRLMGVGDLWAKQCNPWVAFKGVPKDDVPTVVLSHNPDSKIMMDEFRWELMLSGHTHGGQVVLPILGLSPAPVSDKRYVRGMKPWNGRMIQVSAGVGNIRGIRFNCRPEVNVIELFAV